MTIKILIYLIALMLITGPVLAQQSCNKGKKKTCNSTCHKPNSMNVAFYTQKDTNNEDKLNLIGVASLEDINSFSLEKYFPHYIDTAKVNQRLISNLKSTTDKKILVFGGIWWCLDTREVLGKLLFEINKVKFDKEKITFIGTDRKKHSVGYLSQVFNITKVPTIIVLDEGKEVGRIIEYGVSGNWENELAQLLE